MTSRLAPVASLLLAATAMGCHSKRVPEPDQGPGASPVGAVQASGGGTEAGGDAAEDSSATVIDAATGPKMPEGKPRFAWEAPRVVGVEEDVEQQGHKVTLAYHLDVCPGPDRTTLVTHRGLKVQRLEGADATGKAKTQEVRSVEAAASALPTMIIDPVGNFERGTGYKEMIARLVAAFPGENFTELRQAIESGQGATFLDGALGQIWQAWVGAWLHFDPARGASQVIEVADGGGAGTITFDGLTSEGAVRLSAKRVLSADELAQMTAMTAPQSSGNKDDAFQRVVLEWSVESDWPVIRPRRAHARRNVTVRTGGKEQSGLENHAYRFDWSLGGKPDCR